MNNLTTWPTQSAKVNACGGAVGGLRFSAVGFADQRAVQVAGPSASSRRRLPGLRGFTLLELLLAIMIFSVVLAAVHVVFFSAFRLRNKTSEAIERALPLQQTVAVIKRDLANLVPPGGTLAGPLQSTPNLTGTATGNSSSSGMSSSLNRDSGPQFYTATGIVDNNAPWGEIARVSYHLSAPTNNSTPGRDLFRTVARNLLPVVQEEPEEQFLMSGVDNITFQYYDGNAWKDTWDSTLADLSTGLSNTVPRAIKLQLQLTSSGNPGGFSAPVEMVVPILVQARTNILTDVGEVTQ